MRCQIGIGESGTQRKRALVFCDMHTVAAVTASNLSGHHGSCDKWQQQAGDVPVRYNDKHS